MLVLALLLLLMVPVVVVTVDRWQGRNNNNNNDKIREVKGWLRKRMWAVYNDDHEDDMQKALALFFFF